MSGSDVVETTDVELINAAKERFASRRAEFDSFIAEEQLPAAASPAAYSRANGAARQLVCEIGGAEEAGGAQNADVGKAINDAYGLRVGKGKYLHVREATRTLLIDVVGLFITYDPTGSFTQLHEVWFGLSVLDSLRRLVGCYEKIDDPVERSVFEAVYELQNIIVMEHKKAGTEVAKPAAVPHDRLAERLKADLPADQVADILKELRKREIIEEVDGGGWSIRFW